MGSCCAKSDTSVDIDDSGRGVERDTEDDNNVYILQYQSRGEVLKMLELEPTPHEASVMTQSPSLPTDGPAAEECAEAELSDPLSCSSTTIVTVRSERRAADRFSANSLTWTLPEVSATTVSTRFDHARTTSFMGSDDDFSSVEWSANSRKDRRLMLLRDRDRAAQRDMVMNEMDQRRFIAEHANRAHRAILVTYIRNRLEIERRVSYEEFLVERNAFLLHELEAREPLVRRTVELQAHSELLNKMQQQRLLRNRGK
ncbi:uncharacterized protein TEOVI_000141400 [Trypanosoma equiperdum]|uniref:Uncharacterized protein n=4 Tax=Trypanozoon TaxID=39700 RepID=Q38FI0_TRYB2|nr:hypothetical protein, conserved [Trypanosoma brucei gambiense DAL972]XP_803654.1 hypothetical protein, conserved [Trypanosoma brucei brucei TREU927]RHW70064.1 hypothetical protein DPX39_090012100 [Trypanosoma brucei equiperdum]SCU69845.1 hypothetical protein, conserved [Trypanosoma equiperdum]EAN76440.1 hypothetical protein, conserved [Trypanosoma brucei brucei TREU927]CBH14103.1 hypothetical protein, conserved [Trypanosoma brucei gambiense DAL972]|eukprot:XP_011776374.1 hypothetical protein, conserved [Trypanosoma brucei gambiense DAL972]